MLIHQDIVVAHSSSGATPTPEMALSLTARSVPGRSDDIRRLRANNGARRGWLAGPTQPSATTEQRGDTGEVGVRPGFRLLMVLLLVVVSASAVGVADAAPNPRTGAAISAQCAICHGANGMSVAANIPNLAGQRYPYLLSQMRAFKDGTVKSAMMNQMARSLSEEQIEDLSAYFASIPITVGAPRHGG